MVDNDYVDFDLQDEEGGKNHETSNENIKSGYL